MEWNIGEQCPAKLEQEGIMLDWLDGKFVIIIKDQKWSEEELKNFRRNNLQFDFVKYGQYSLFLLTILECIETSDLPFSPQEQDYDFKEAKAPLEVLVILSDAKDIIAAKRAVTLDSAMSQCILDDMKRQQETPFDEEDYNASLDKLQAKLEPFEMEKLIQASKVVKA